MEEEAVLKIQTHLHAKILKQNLNLMFVRLQFKLELKKEDKEKLIRLMMV